MYRGDISFENGADLFPRNFAPQLVARLMAVKCSYQRSACGVGAVVRIGGIVHWRFHDNLLSCLLIHVPPLPPNKSPPVQSCYNSLDLPSPWRSPLFLEMDSRSSAPMAMMTAELPIFPSSSILRTVSRGAVVETTSTSRPSGPICSPARPRAPWPR